MAVQRECGWFHPLFFGEPPPSLESRSTIVQAGWLRDQWHRSLDKSTQREHKHDEHGVRECFEGEIASSPSPPYDDDGTSNVAILLGKWHQLSSASDKPHPSRDRGAVAPHIARQLLCCYYFRTLSTRSGPPLSFSYSRWPLSPTAYGGWMAGISPVATQIA